MFKDKKFFLLNRAHQDLNCLEKEAHILDKFYFYTTTGINELLYPYVVTLDLFSPIVLSKHLIEKRKKNDFFSSLHITFLSLLTLRVSLLVPKTSML